MLQTKDFQKMRKEIEGKDSTREQIIQLSREIIQLSKQCIYAVHRKDLKTAEAKAKEMKKQVDNLKKIDISLDTNIATAAYQEYAEAVTFLGVIKDHKLPTSEDIGLDSESYLLGICDLTGELMRKAVDCIINKQYAEAKEIKELVAQIYGEFLQFNLRNGELRKKSDQIKWNLQKLEDLMYDVEMKGR